MRRIRKAFAERIDKPYPKSFSYGIVEIPGCHEYMTPEELIHQADDAMYLQKRDHKEQYRQQAN